MSNSTKVDVVIAGKHISGVRLSDLGAGAPIAVPARTVVGEGDLIKVDGNPCKVTSAVHDNVNSAEMSVNIYVTPLKE